jgi:DeoR/GlpR family transcriptional regulator of sugar metabolism
MIVGDLVTLQKESALSPEKLGEAIGVSGMTIRRWLSGAACLFSWHRF